MACIALTGKERFASHEPTGEKVPPHDLHARFDQAAAEIGEQVVAWRHHLHSHPELSNRETATAQMVADHLRALKLDEVRTDIAGHGVVGVLRGGRDGDRVVALRADIDALPIKEESGEDFSSTVIDDDYPGGPYPVAHACGHDCHTAMLMGAASVLAQARDELPGTVLFVFQPAEEGPPIDEEGGAREMEAEGALSDPAPTMVFGMHVTPYPKGVVAYLAGNQYGASVLIRITVHGKGVHGSTPWEGIDPLPPAADIIVAMGQVYRQLPGYDPLAITIGHVEDVGRFNVVGESVQLLGTIRCTVEADMEVARERVKRTAEHVAQAYGATADVEFLQPVPAVHNTQPWIDAILPTLEHVVGHDHLVKAPPGLGYDDVSVFVNKYGGAYLQLGAQDVELRPDGSMAPIPGGRGIAMNHNPHFYADDSVLETGVRMHANVALDHLTGTIPVPN
ncbi:MAG TPA: amidohydrolase [Solirubrobacterales bacterium]|nr:amidohydrolase [Solirubrobacterales bacterium]